jgi:hypothetical protein
LGELFFDGVDFAAGAARLGAAFATGLAFVALVAGEATTAGSVAGVVSDSDVAGAGSGSALATPIELEMVR